MHCYSRGLTSHLLLQLLENWFNKWSENEEERREEVGDANSHKVVIVDHFASGPCDGLSDLLRDLKLVRNLIRNLIDILYTPSMR